MLLWPIRSIIALGCAHENQGRGIAVAKIMESSAVGQPSRTTAGMKCRRHQFERRSGPPSGPSNTSSFWGFPETSSASSYASGGGNPTDHRLQVLVGPMLNWPLASSGGSVV